MLQDVKSFFLLPQGNNKASAEQKLCNYKCFSEEKKRKLGRWQKPLHGQRTERPQLNLASSRQEVKHRNNNMTSGYFSKWKTLRVDTSTKTSKKRQTQALLLILRSGTNPAVVLMTHACNCGHKSASQRQLSAVLCRGGLITQPVGVTVRRRKTRSEL